MKAGIKNVTRIGGGIDATRVALALGALVALRIGLALVVLSGVRVPGFPRYEYDPRPGDAFAYHAAVREVLSVPARLSWAFPLCILLLVALVLLGWLWRSRPRRRPLLALAACWCLGALLALVVLRMRPTGSPTIGWPLVWSLPLAPYRAVGPGLTPDVAYGFAVTLSLVANAVTVVATYLLGLNATRRRGIGFAAAGLYAFWPLLILLVAARDATGTWLVDLGLHAYSEPLSTALVAVALMLLVRPASSPQLAVLAGALLGAATAVRLSNAAVAAVAVLVLLVRERRADAVRVSAAGLAFLPVVLAHWPNGYASLPESTFRDDAFALRYAAVAWQDSEVWGPLALVLLVPPALVGALAVTREAALLLGGAVVATAAFYTFYWYTPLHPRFLLVALPPLFVLWAAGVWAAAARGRRLLIPHRPAVDLRR